MFHKFYFQTEEEEGEEGRCNIFGKFIRKRSAEIIYCGVGYKFFIYTIMLQLVALNKQKVLKVIEEEEKRNE